ncbi:MAG: 23S rRNA (uracil(1939)-C(5))-methyltransferase RlmD [Acidibacillus sp.]|nr:23S rRNA (uracil(1939)-C(5))-methyltransferase RlmD [Acidibacillus sp.]
MGKDQLMAPPVAVLDQISVEVLRLGYRGEGVARYNGFTVFIDGALAGELVKVQISKVMRTFAVGKILSIIRTSPQRETPPCEVFDLCGGCQLQHVSYDAQLQFKQQTVKDALERIGKFDSEVVRTLVLDTLLQSDPWRYRNKVSLMATARSGRFVAGFVEEGTHEPIEAQTCMIRPKAYDELLHTITTNFTELGIRPYDEKNRRGDVRQLVIRSNNANEVMIVMITQGRELPRAELFCKVLAERMPEGYRLVSVIQQKHSIAADSTEGQFIKERVLFGSPYMQEEIAGLTFRISASAFLQVNPIQTLVLYEKALASAKLTKTDVVFDLFSGVGTLSLLAARQAKAVYGVESIRAATEDATFNAKNNGLTNTQFLSGFVEDIVPQLVSDRICPDVVLLDPPRAGCAAQVLTALIDLAPQRIVYISCNPATLARDLRHLVDGGYVMTSIQPVDMFPQTAHVEVIASLLLHDVAQ